MLSKEAREAFYSVLNSNLYDPNTTARAGANLTPRWIREDNPRTEDLKKNSYPRISLEFIGSPDDFAGYYDTTRQIAIARTRVIVHIWVLPDHRCTYPIGQDPTGTFMNAALRDRIASEIKSILLSKMESFKEQGIVIVPKTVTDPTDRDAIDNNGATTHYHSEVRAGILYSDVRTTS